MIRKICILLVVVIFCVQIGVTAEMAEKTKTAEDKYENGEILYSILPYLFENEDSEVTREECLVSIMKVTGFYQERYVEADNEGMCNFYY